MTNEKLECKLCGNDDLNCFLDLGMIPLADLLLAEKQLGQKEEKFPLSLVFCNNCALVQNTENVAPEIIYGGDYPYFSSVSKTMVEHFKASALELIETRKLNSTSLVIEAASNDGYMLQNFVEKNIPVLGIDPARGPAEVAIEAGVPTLIEFFEKKMALKLKEENHSADLLIGNNVLNLVPYLDDFAESTNLLLKDNGVAVLEVPYLFDLIDKSAFDNIFHQNLYYFSATALDFLFRRYSLFINESRKIPTFGGSLRIFIEKRERRDNSILELLNDEKRKGMLEFNFYENFGNRVEEIKKSLVDLLWDLKNKGKKIAVFGAAGGMATTLLNYVGIDNKLIDFAVDSNEFKHGKYMLGNHLKIYPPNKLIEDGVDYTLLLAWNYKDEILKQEKEYMNKGGKFIIPIPKPHII